MKGRTSAERSQLIFSVMPQWVSRSSKLVVDNSVDKDRLKALGFTNIVSSGGSGGRGREASTAKVMDYLKKWTPKIFQVRVT